MIDTMKALLKNKEDFWTFAQNENKTITSDKTNKTVTDEIKKVLGALDKVTNQTIRDALVVVNTTVLSCTMLVDTFLTQAYAGVATYLSSEYTALATLVASFQTSVTTILSALATAVTEATINSSLAAACEKIAFAKFDTILKNASTFSDKCFKNFSDYNSKSYASQINLVFKNVLSACMKPLANVTSCMKNNKISDAKGMDATTNCTRDSFLTCITWVNFQLSYRCYYLQF